MRFPIMHGDMLRAIPLGMISPHEKQAGCNHGQTLKRLAERGGLSPCEAIAVLFDRKWAADPEAEIKLVRLTARYLSQGNA